MTFAFFINQTTQNLVFLFSFWSTRNSSVSFDGLGIKKIDETISKNVILFMTFLCLGKFNQSFSGNPVIHNHS